MNEPRPPVGELGHDLVALRAASSALDVHGSGDETCLSRAIVDPERLIGIEVGYGMCSAQTPMSL